MEQLSYSIICAGKRTQRKSFFWLRGTKLADAPHLGEAPIWMLCF